MSVNNIKAQLQNYRTADEITAARKSGKIDASVEALSNTIADKEQKLKDYGF